MEKFSTGARDLVGRYTISILSIYIGNTFVISSHGCPYYYIIFGFLHMAKPTQFVNVHGSIILSFSIYFYDMCIILRMIYSFYIGNKLTKVSPNIPYLMFAADYIILCRVTKRAVRKFKHILVHYCRVFGRFNVLKN